MKRSGNEALSYVTIATTPIVSDYTVFSFSRFHFSPFSSSMHIASSYKQSVLGLGLGLRQL